MDLLSVIIYAVISGLVGTMLGSLFSLFVKPKKEIVYILYGISAGLMMGICFFNLLPASFSNLSPYICLLGVAIGYLIVMVSDIIISKSKGAENKKFSTLMLLVIAIHNFPEGMAIGVAGNLKIGMSTILGITFHDVPEGFVIGLPQQGVYGKKTVMFNAFLAGFPTVLGALFGWYAIGFGNGVASFSLAVASGAMLALVFSDLLPISFTKNTLLNSGSVLFGIILMKLLTFLD